MHALASQLAPTPTPASAPRKTGLGVAATDAQLVERLRRGDQWAREALYRRYLPQVRGLTVRLLANSVEAEDVVQDTFVLVFEEIHKLRDPGSLKGWMMQIAVRQTHRRFRRRKLLRALGLLASTEDSQLEAIVAPGTSPEVQAELGKIDRALRRTAVAARLAWMLRYVEGCSLEEVAARCECSLATAKRRIAAANQHVKQHVQIEEPAGE